ncbi:myxosortase-dependent M36 family metallopeptidase [Pyxidicoccus sp. MSG2]|uniref:myxosortase-dependent M36 family metallopeptidase n=1 Tax=Pyxidicoccus sp. MSG2 TaxID=2996790 RepID=UPI00226D93E0|nr:myxosortase-dependent M36 family metallopeptidase [Pyxidicoccus sp. MSG2]MCY1022814.1 myxosortase-dependent M36 family metallopeptidase [Pyxidicoccus sp. MSG2]
MKSRIRTLASLALALASAEAGAGRMPNHDALPESAPSMRASAEESVIPNARVLHRDARLGVPTFVWVSKPTPSKSSPTSLRAEAPYARLAPAAAALAQLDALAPLYGGRSLAQLGASVARVSRNEQGTSVVTLKQELDGLEVFRGSVNLLLDRQNALVAASGHLSSDTGWSTTRPANAFRLSASEATSAAYLDLTGQRLDAGLLQPTGAPAGRYTRYELASFARPLEVGLRIPARVKPVLFELPDGLVPAHYVELNTGAPGSTTSDYYAYVISAKDGRVLFRKDLTADATHSYRVWADSTPPFQPFAGPAGNDPIPHPTGTPDGYSPTLIAPNLVTLDSVPFSRNDPWLAAGATETTGNNAEAYADLSAPDGLSAGDPHARTTDTDSFDHPYDFNLLPYETSDQLQAAITQLFYMNNWLHDWYYDAGFTEQDGNAQVDNYGRGGVGGDSILAEAQDYGGVNNANMSTPADGARPRMQMYIFPGSTVNGGLTVTAPADVARGYDFAPAAFGPPVFTTTAQVVQALDASDPVGASTTDGCSALTNAADVAGRIAFVDRGTCSLQLKVLNAQAAGAVGVIVANDSSPMPGGMGASATLAQPTIGSLLVSRTDGDLLRSRLDASVTATLSRRPVGDRDGTIDAGIVAHEWGHYISNRLIHDGSGLSNNQGRGMGEGWADFHALLLAVREEDAQAASNPDWTGTFAVGEYATRNIVPRNSAYFGIRRVPYSVDFKKNPLTFKHIAAGNALPATWQGTPIPYSPSFRTDGVDNAEVHNTGEVWATMLWECYVSLLRTHPFAEARQRMKSYIVAGYKLTPASPTVLEARDALLAAVYATDPEDYPRFADAFARRGAGIGAVAPDRDSTTQTGVVESFRTGADVAFVSAELTADDAMRTCDVDDYLDNGEAGRLRITLRNIGVTPLQATSATVTADNPAVQLANGGVVTFPSVGLFETATVDLPVTLAGATARSTVNLTIAYRDGNGVATGDKLAKLAVKVEQDELPQTSATESVESHQLPWEMTSARGGDAFVVSQDGAYGRAFLGVDVGHGADFALVTPELHVGTGEFSFTFRHRYAFENDGLSYYDGGVLELSEDGGQTWTDLGNSITSNGYTGTLATYDGNVNPLSGRRAFRGVSFAFSQKQLVSTKVNLGTAHAGKTVLIRFRIGTDEGGANVGWLIDDIAFTGLTHLPFTTIADEQGLCTTGVVSANAGADRVADENTDVSLGGSGTTQAGGTLTWRWEQVTGPLVVLNGANTATPSFTAPEVFADTTLTFRLTVSDGGMRDKDLVEVLVRQVNKAPMAAAGPAQAVDEGSTVTLQGGGEDPDGDALVHFTWTQVSGPPVTLSGANTATPTFTAPEVQSSPVDLVFQLVVGDGLLESQLTTTTVTVRNAPRAPTVSADPDLSAQGGGSVTLSATGTDPEQGTLTYAWSQTSGPTVQLQDADKASASFSAPAVSTSTTLTFVVKVTAESGLSAEDTVSVVVNPAPVVQPKASGCSSTGTSSATALPLALLLLALLERRRTA